MFLYEVLFRGQADGTISGQHVIYGVSTEFGDKLGPAQPVVGEEVEAIIGEVCAAQAATIDAKSAEIASLMEELLAVKSELAAIKDA